MKRHHTVDKFGRYSASAAVRLDEYGKHVHVGNKRLRFVADPIDPLDSANKRYVQRYYTSNSKYNRLDKRVKDLQDELSKLAATVMIPDSNSWNARGLKITNVGAGEKMEDVSRLSQTCTYDVNVDNFKCGNRYFNLVENSANEPVVISVSDSVSGEVELAEYKNTLKKVIPTHMLRWRGGELVTGDGKKIAWNEQQKKFVIN